MRKGTNMSQGNDLMVHAAIEEEKRMQACAEEMGKVLEHYGCVLSPQVIISRSGTRIKVDIVARTPVAPPLKG